MTMFPRSAGQHIFYLCNTAPRLHSGMCFWEEYLRSESASSVIYNWTQMLVLLLLVLSPVTFPVNSNFNSLVQMVSIDFLHSALLF